MFQVTTTYDHRGMTALCRAVRKTFRRPLSIAMRILGWMFIAVLAAFMGLMYWLGMFLWDLYTVLAIAVSLLVLCLIFFEDHLTGWIGGGMTYGYRKENTAVFDETEYVLTMPSASGHWTYDTVQAFCETDAYFIFLLDKKHGQVFDKSGFTEGTPDAFRDFITQKTGLSVRFIK